MHQILELRFIFLSKCKLEVKSGNKQPKWPLMRYVFNV